MAERERQTDGLTARAAAMVSCHSCRLLCRLPSAHDRGKVVCPRCGANLHHRKPDSLRRTWALVVAAIILYIPANVLPITLTSSLGSTQSDTILSGVVYFMTTGSWHLAVIIFVASIIVPLLKLMVLIYLLLSVHTRSLWRPADRTRLYRLIDAVGRWSMLDIFAVTVVVALVRMGALGTIQAGPGAPFFAAVVVTTMLATHFFDPRLIWDVVEEAR